MERPLARCEMTAAGPAAWMPDGTWPDGPIDDDAPAGVAIAAHIARVVINTAGSPGLDLLADKAALDRKTLRSVVAGDTWPDLPTLVALEASLGVSLWP